jgi:hypothetical protein
MKRIEVMLRHNTNENEFFKIDLLPASTKIGQKWFQDVKEATSKGKLLEKEMSFFGWRHSPFNLPKLCTLINQHIEIINEASIRLNWDRKPFIKERIDLNNLNQDILNKAHHQFELLIGQFWENAEYYKQADNELRYSIHRLNSLIHEIESFIDTLDYAKNNPDGSIASIRLTYNNVEREHLEPEDYLHFTTDLVFGDINLGYCQSGKTHVEAWFDNDEFIQGNNINGLRYHSADTIINFVSNKVPVPEKTKEFHDWLISKGVKNLQPTYFIDENSQYQGLGWLKVGSIDTKPFDNLSTTEIQNLLGKYQDIYQVTCIDGGQTVSRTFNERRGSEDLRKKITAEL